LERVPSMMRLLLVDILSKGVQSVGPDGERTVTALPGKVSQLP
jgi:hypothetical protein